MSLLFYDDSPVFGGHEIISLLGVEAVLQSYTGPVHFLASAANAKLCDKISALASLHPHLTLETLPYHSSKLEALRNRLLPSRTSRLAARLRTIAPSLVVAIQGNIEHSSLVLLAARSAGIPSTSYIPVPHTHAEMGAKLGFLRDLLCTHLFRTPHSFVTITAEMERLLKRKCGPIPTHIVLNGVDTTRFIPADPSTSRATLGLPLDKLLFGTIGRIEFTQKQQHLLVQAVAASPTLRDRCHLVFAGDGPDASSLTTLLTHSGVHGTVLPWSDPTLLYPALDALVIPSRYEGLPLVMLEALSCETPVLATDRDGMKDVLPHHWRFPPGDTAALASLLSSFLHPPDPQTIKQLASRVRSSMSLNAFRESFASTILSLAGIPFSGLQNAPDIHNP